MSEKIDVYSDQFQVNTGPYGSTLNFLLSQPTPPAPGTTPQAELLASVRMSLEHLKLMTFVLRNQILTHEEQTATTIPIPPQVLNGLRISFEDWDAFWHRA